MWCVCWGGGASGGVESVSSSRLFYSCHVTDRKEKSEGASSVLLSFKR